MMKSETLLREIMILLTRVNTGFTEIQGRVTSLETKVSSIDEKLGHLIETAFTDNLIDEHVELHQRAKRGIFKRIVLRLLGEKIR